MNPMFHRALDRPDDYHEQSVESQWHIDKRLGILDWDMMCDHAKKVYDCPECLKRYENRDVPRKLVDGNPEVWDKLIDLFGITVAYDDSNPKRQGWGMSWKHGTMDFGGKKDKPEWGKCCAAMFAYLWDRGVDVQLSMELAVGYAHLVVK